MWRELWESIVARLLLCFNLLLDGAFVLVWAYISNFVFRFIPDQLPAIDRDTLDVYMVISANLLLVGASAYGLYDLYCLLLRLGRDVVKKWYGHDER